MLILMKIWIKTITPSSHHHPEIWAVFEGLSMATSWYLGNIFNGMWLFFRVLDTLLTIIIHHRKYMHFYVRSNLCNPFVSEKSNNSAFSLGVNIEHSLCFLAPGPWFNTKITFISIGNPIIKIKIFIMGIPILGNSIFILKRDPDYYDQ